MPGIPGAHQPGFQGSTHSGATVTLYQHGDDRIVLSPDGPGAFPFVGRGQGRDSIYPFLRGVTTSKVMGAASGTFSITVKPSRAAEDLLSRVVDDDWVDISFYNHDKSWHVMRGLVDEIHKDKAIGGSGATTETFTITGRDFAKIWEITPIWFNPTATDKWMTEVFAQKSFDGIPGDLGSPADAVEYYLKGFLEGSAADKGPNWAPPRGMPGISGDSFIDSVAFNQSTFQNIPRRKNINPNALIPNGTLWELASQNSDPMFTDFYADVFPLGDPNSQQIANSDPLSPEDTMMTVVVRDKVFPITDTQTATLIPGYTSPWNFIPVCTARRQDAVTVQTSRSGYERYNAFYTAGVLLQETMKIDALTMMSALVDEEDIRRHGLRRMDIQSSMIPDPLGGDGQPGSLDMPKLANQYRFLARDWYCLNPYLLSGSVMLANGRPDIKIGCRFRIPGAASDRTEDESYYVEQVTHNWVYTQRTKTTLGVTRGWVGTDETYLDALNFFSSKYTIPTPEFGGTS